MRTDVRIAVGLVISFLLLLFQPVISIPLKAEGAAAEILPPIDVFLLIDQSGSMKKTDPQGVRLEASKYLVDFLSADRTEVLDHRLGVINFGTTAPEEKMFPLMSLVEANLEPIKQKMVALDLGDTSFIAALQRAAQGFKKEKEALKRQQAIVIFTDGEPDDPRKLSKEAYFHEIQHFVSKELPETTIYVVAIDAKGSYWPKDKRYWDQIVSERTYKLERMDEQELEKIFSGILIKLLKTAEIKWDNVPVQGLDVEVEPYLERITFSILKENPEVKLTILRENGQKLTEKDPGVKYYPGRVREIFSVADPSPGIWKYRIEEGRGKVEVGKAVIPIEVRLLSPYSPYPQGKTMSVVATFLKRDGTPVKEHRAYGLWLGAKVLTPEGKEQFVEFKSDGKGMYSGSKAIETTKRGTYRIFITMKGGNLLVFQQEVPIAVEPIPYLEVLKPQEGSQFTLRRSVEIEVKMLTNGLPVNPADIFADPPNSLIWAKLKDPMKKESSLRLEQAETKGLFKASLPSSDVRTAGQYAIRFELSGRQKTGALFKAVPEDILFFKKRDWIDFLLFQWYLMIPIVCFLFLFFDWARIGRQNEWWLWRFGLPRLSGTLYIRAGLDSEEIVVPLLGRKRRISRTGQASIFDKAYAGTAFARKKRDEEGTWKTLVYFRPKSKAQSEEQLLPNVEKSVGDVTVRYEEL